MRKFRLFFYLNLFYLMFFLGGCDGHQKEYFFNANQVKDHPSPDQVKMIMNAQPDSSFYRLFFGKERFIQLYYAEDSTEFRFKDDKLLEIIIHKPSILYSPESITKFGLKYVKPVEQDTTAFFRWLKQYDGFDVINFYMVGSGKRDRKVNYKIYFRLYQ